jgi:hypothetical protein
MLQRVALVTTDVSEEGFSLCISSQRASVASYGYILNSPILVALMMEALSSSETSVLTRATRCNVPEDVILRKPIVSKRRVFWLFEIPDGGQCPQSHSLTAEVHTNL